MGGGGGVGVGLNGVACEATAVIGGGGGVGGAFLFTWLVAAAVTFQLDVDPVELLLSTEGLCVSWSVTFHGLDEREPEVEGAAWRNS